MIHFETKIVGFLCNWCSYEGADAAGRARAEYPASLRIVRVLCSGRVDPQFVLEAFKAGADGVIILGCHPGDCHYKEGNIQIMRRYRLLKNMLPQFGVEEERLWLEWVSAGGHEEFVKIVSRMAESIEAMGPLNP